MKKRQILTRRRREYGSEKQYVLLFVAVVALFALQAGLEQTEWSTLIELGVSGTALMLALGLADVSSRRRTIVGAFIALALVGAVVQLVRGETSDTSKTLVLVNLLLVAAGTPAVFVAIRRHPSISTRTVFGAVTIYVLIGLFFAFLYRAFVQYNAHSFVSANGPLTPAAMQYFSFITITTTGYGDITAASGPARATVALEALIGQVYLVTIVAVVVGKIGQTRSPRAAK